MKTNKSIIQSCEEVKARQLDLDKIKSRIKRNVSSDEALKDIVPLDIPAEVIQEKKTMQVSSPILGKNNRIGITIKYV